MSQYSSDPRQGYTEGVKHLLRYFRGALELVLTYGGDLNGEKRELGGIGLVGYADSNYALKSQDRRSTIGYMFFFNGVVVS